MSSPSGSQTNQCDSRRRIETKEKGNQKKKEENSITFGQEIDGQLSYPVRSIARSNRRKRDCRPLLVLQNKSSSRLIK